MEKREKSAKSSSKKSGKKRKRKKRNSLSESNIIRNGKSNEFITTSTNPFEFETEKRFNSRNYKVNHVYNVEEKIKLMIRYFRIQLVQQQEVVQIHPPVDLHQCLFIL